jgi:hypothetical protein
MTEENKICADTSNRISRCQQWVFIELEGFASFIAVFEDFMYSFEFVKPAAKYVAF